MTGAFFSRLVSSETLVIIVPDLELFLKKVAASDLKGVIIERESTRFKSRFLKLSKIGRQS